MYSVKVNFVLRPSYAGTQERGGLASTHSQPRHWQGVFGQYRLEKLDNICIFTYFMEVKTHKPLY